MKCLGIIWYSGYVLNVFITIQTSKALIQEGTRKMMMTHGTFTMDDEKTHAVMINSYRASHDN